MNFLPRIFAGGCLLVSTLGTAQTLPPLAYELALQGQTLHVTLQYQPLEKDSTVFQYGQPLFGGQQDIFDGIKNITADAPASVTIIAAKRQIIVRFPPAANSTLRYDITDTHTAKQGTRGELFRPMISADYFYSHGLNIFLEPQLRQPITNVQQSVKWKTPPQFPWFFGADPAASGTKVSKGSVDDFLMAPITAASDLTIRKITLRGIDNYLVLRAKGVTKTDEAKLIGWFTKYDAVLKAFWRDRSGKTFSLILQPFLNVDHDISGIAYGSGFIGKYKGDTLLTAHRMFVLSHEIDHHWIGQQIDFGSEEQWFNEGFNDFVAAYMLISAGLISPAEYEKDFNATLRDHYNSAIKNTRNDSIFKNYWKLGDFSRLPYRRGNIFAFCLDNEITIASDGKKNLRDLLLDLSKFRQSKPEQYQMKREDFLTLAAAYIPREKITQYLNEYIADGDPINFAMHPVLDFYQFTIAGGVPQLHITDEQEFLRHFQIK